MMSRMLPVLLLTMFGVCSIAMGDPPIGWRTDATGLYPDATPPTEWSKTQNVVWKQELPGGSYGSPVIVGDRIFVVSDPAELFCLRASDGEVLWQQSNSAAETIGEEKAAELSESWQALNDRKRQLQREFSELRKAKPDAKEEQDQKRDQIREVGKEIGELTRNNPLPNRGGAGNTAGTPVCDGETVFAAFGSGIVAAYSLEGQRKWIRFIEGSTIGFGHSSSPLLIGDLLFVHYGDLVALDATNGKNVWRTELNARHASPVAARIGDMDVLISPAGRVIRAADGKILLEENALSVSEGSPIVDGRVVYALSGKATALKLPAEADDEIKLETLWQENASRGRRTPSPAVFDGLLYAVTTNGILEVSDTSNGDIVYRKRLDIGNNLYASVTIAGQYVFIGSTKGTTVVLQQGREYKEVAHNELESYGANPVFVGKRMYLRTRKHLFCIGE